MAKQKGERRERELVNRLDDAGFALMRGQASGSATDRNLPDVIASNAERFYDFEEKALSGNPIYLDAAEVYELEFFPTILGDKPRISIRFNKQE